MSDMHGMPSNSPTATRMARRALTLAAACAALHGCTVGPDYKSPAPEAPMQDDWTGQRDPVSGRPVTSHPRPGPTEITEWWRTFNDPTLSSLIERAANGNLTLAQAESRVRQARAVPTGAQMVSDRPVGLHSGAPVATRQG